MFRMFQFFFSALVLLVIFVGCGAETESMSQRREIVMGPAATSAESIPSAPAADTVASSSLNQPERFGEAYLMGKFDPVRHPDFVPVGSPYTERPGMLLRKEALEAFRKMWEAARKDGIHLKIISSTRTFHQQKAIWEAKWSRFAKTTPAADARALKILEYSAMPGASRHHWGTDIDLNDLNNPTFEAGGKYAGVYDWLQKNAHRFGFCQPYTPKGPERPLGYNEEKWHWTYQPLSAPMLEAYSRQINDTLITGFLGAETARSIGIVRHYVQGINESCR